MSTVPHIRRSLSRSRFYGHLPVQLGLALAIVAAGLLSVDGVIPPWRRALPRGYEQATIVVGERPVRVEVARTTEEQTLGLGYRDGLEPDSGMLFVYEEAWEQSFWMKGMRFCLDIVWIEGGRIVGAMERICPAPAGAPEDDIPRTRSPEPVRFVLEVPAGWLDAHGFAVGTQVTIPEDLLTRASG